MINEKTLRDYTIERLNKDLIENSLINPKVFTILIVDVFSSKILSNYLTMSELINKGIFSIESIYNERKAYPNYNAIYFISPTLSSCVLIEKDFEDFNNPKYGTINIYFTHSLSEQYLDIIASEGILNRTLACKELNLSFCTFEKNMFNLQFESGLKIFNLPVYLKTQLINTTAQRIMTLVQTLNVFPYIQYYKKSNICFELSERLEPLLQSFGSNKKLKRKGLILLTDRTIDLFSPLLHEYNYEFLLYDLLPVKNDKVSLKGKNKKINLPKEETSLWRNFRKLNINEIKLSIKKVFEEIINTHNFDEPNNVINKNKEYNLDEIKKILENISNYKIINKQIFEQIELFENISNEYKNNFVEEIIKFEKYIISKEKNEEIIQKVKDLKLKLGNQNNILIRLYLLLFISKSIDKKELNVLFEDISTEIEPIINNLNILSINEELYNNEETIEEDKLNERLVLETNINQNKYENIIEQALRYELDIFEYPIKNIESKELSKLRKRNNVDYKVVSSNNFENLTVNENDDLLIFFNIGGLSRNEIIYLQKLEEKTDNKIIIGSTNILTANEYISQIREITSFDSNDINNDCLNENMSINIGNSDKNIGEGIEESNTLLTNEVILDIKD